MVSNLHNLLFLGFKQLVDILYIGIGEFLNIVLTPLYFIFAEILHFFECIVTIAANIANGHPGLLGNLPCMFDQFLSPFFGKGGNVYADYFAIAGGVKREFRSLNRLFYIPYKILVPGLDNH